MENIAQIGNAPVWVMQLANEDGSFDFEGLKRLIKEQTQPNYDFFDTYVGTPLPISFLSTVLGGLAQALRAIIHEQKGFIRINDGSLADLDIQKVTANDVLQGTACFIDGLATLMLAEAGLLETVTKALPNIGVSTSVIRLLRKIAADFDPPSSTIGTVGVIDENLHFSPRNKEREETFRKRLLLAADLLETLPNNVIAKTYPKLEGDVGQDHLLPDYFVDAFRYAQQEEAHIVTDDALLIRSYKSLGESSIPKHFSSFSLIQNMAENGQITRDEYLRYFAQLTFYRYHLLSLSVDSMLDTVLPSTQSGIITPAPRNIGF